MSVVRFLDVTKEYPRTGVALSNVSFRIEKGEFCFLTGPSGAGKSTLLKLIYMEERPTFGDVWVSDLASREAKRKEIAHLRRRLGIVFQDFRLLEDRTAEANIAFALEVTGAPKDSIQDRVSRVLSQVGLASKGTAYPRELSGGEQQRVAIARALVNDPFILIADEPSGNLDERATRSVFHLLREINRSGTAVIMATHNLDLIRKSDYRTIELNHGRIVYDSADRTALPEVVQGLLTPNGLAEGTNASPKGGAGASSGSAQAPSSPFTQPGDTQPEEPHPFDVAQSEEELA